MKGTRLSLQVLAAVLALALAGPRGSATASQISTAGATSSVGSTGISVTAATWVFRAQLLPSPPSHHPRQHDTPSLVSSQQLLFCNRECAVHHSIVPAFRWSPFFLCPAQKLLKFGFPLPLSLLVLTLARLCSPVEPSCNCTCLHGVCWRSAALAIVETEAASREPLPYCLLILLRAS